MLLISCKQLITLDIEMSPTPTIVLIYWIFLWHSDSIVLYRFFRSINRINLPDSNFLLCFFPSVLPGQLSLVKSSFLQSATAGQNLAYLNSDNLIQISFYLCNSIQFSFFQILSSLFLLKYPWNTVFNNPQNTIFFINQKTYIIFGKDNSRQLCI